MTDAMELDCVIFGGGAAGLWALDELVRAGSRCLLLEAHELGLGQTVASQGIIHGGLKYTLSGLLSSSAKVIADMPMVWRKCLSGESEPDLSATRIRSHHCLLWQTTSLKSRLGMVGARAGLRVAPQRLPDSERPPILSRCPGVVARMNEQVIEPWSFIAELSARHRARIMKIDAPHGLELSMGDPPNGSHPVIERVRLINPESGEPLDLKPRTVVLTAGSGNADLRDQCGLAASAMQRRPLHMAMLRGANLPQLNGHCTDGAATRVTITSTRDFSDLPVWQIGGQIAERGVTMDAAALIRFARDELLAVLPGVELRGVEWATYRVDRAEASNAGARPSDVSATREGNVISAWPTKLALAPRLATTILGLVGSATVKDRRDSDVRLPNDWPRPVVALPPWETTTNWTRLD